MAHEHDWLNEECATCDKDWNEWQAEIKDGERKTLVFIFDCVDCANFYGEQTLTEDGRLLCPSCYSEQTVESVFVEAVKTKAEVAPFTVGLCDACAKPTDRDEGEPYCYPCDPTFAKQ
jgi:hypothetical protein